MHERVINPLPQVPLRKQVPAQQCNQIGESSSHAIFELKILDQ